MTAARASRATARVVRRLDELFAIETLARALAGLAGTGQTNDQSSKLNCDRGWPTADGT